MPVGLRLLGNSELAIVSKHRFTIDSRRHMSEVARDRAPRPETPTRRRWISGSQPRRSGMPVRSRISRSTRAQASARPEHDTAGVLWGAIQVMLLSKDPHLAVRAAWVLLRERESTMDENALGEYRTTPR